MNLAQHNITEFDIHPDFNEIWDMCPEENGVVVIYGKLINVPRFQKSFGHDYKFSGLNHVAEPIPNNLQSYMDLANSIISPDYKFNQLLINWYENGLHYIGAHSDDETQLVKGSPILSISLGETRKFRIRNKKTKKIIKDVLLKNGDIVIMENDFQSLYTQ